MGQDRPREPHARDPRRLPSGRWQARVAWWDEHGRRRESARTFASHREARAWAREEERRLRELGRPPAEDALASYLDRWLESMVGRVRPTTLRSYRAMAAHARAALGDRPLTRLTPLDLQAWLADLQAAGKSPRTAQYAYAVLRHALQDAADWGLLPANPAARAKPPRVPRRELRVPTPEEARRLLQAAEGHRLYALWAFLATTGTRRGEALGLRWEDVDWQRRVILVRQALTGTGSRKALGPVKTDGGRRSVALDPWMEDVLRRHREEQRLDRLEAGAGWEETGLVFTTRRGRWLDPGNVLRDFKILLAKAGLPTTYRIHDLRHAMATAWLAAGVSPKVVSERLGHASVAFTLQVYGHVLPNAQAEAAARMVRLLADDLHQPPADGGTGDA
ncbi:conserved protein of unknown function [Candidatus Hydrogenisulfobacillus filiaventi]|uniref:Site-specific integrase n=1 Tax=Candidatus Hydrogenisulfobacillus filiaventi TaxID=2707344 RepID=A0A6F8ZIV4_9FIRM|nr:conserved protein of unknown function [Candidatus Hydrogenisulfobacillus filiaventi]